MRKSTLIFLLTLITISSIPISSADSVRAVETIPYDIAAPGRRCLEEGAKTNLDGDPLICARGLWRIDLNAPAAGEGESSKFVSKFSKITETQLEKIVKADWNKWRKRKVNSNSKYQIFLQDGYSKDWEKTTVETIKYIGDVLVGNGLKLVQTPIWAFGDTEEYRSEVFKNFAKTASCNPPYIPEGEEAIYCATADIGSGGIRIGKMGQPMANGYRLTKEDKKFLSYFVAHDMAIFYEVQAEYGDVAYTGNKYQIPAWIREGTAQLVGILVANDLTNKNGSYIKFKESGRLVGAKPNTICPRDLQYAEGKEKFWPDDCSYSMNFYAAQLLVAKYGGFDNLFKFHKALNTNSNWSEVFQQVFGISREDFYKEWWSYLKIPQSKWPIIRAPAPADRY